MTQCEKVKRHLDRFGSITPMDAIRDYGIMRLGARVYDLKRRGVSISAHLIRGTNRFGEPTRYAEYGLEDKKCSTK